MYNERKPDTLCTRCVARDTAKFRTRAFHTYLPLKMVKIAIFLTKEKTTPRAHRRSPQRLGHAKEMERGQRGRRW